MVDQRACSRDTCCGGGLCSTGTEAKTPWVALALVSLVLLALAIDFAL